MNSAGLNMQKSGLIGAVLMGLCLITGMAEAEKSFLQLSHARLYPGMVQVLTLRLPTDTEITGLWSLERSVPYYAEQGSEDKNRYVAYVPIGLGQKPGQYAVLLKYRGNQGEQNEKSFFEVLPKKFPSQRVSLPTSEKKELTRSPSLETEADVLGAIFSQHEVLRCFDGNFVRPLPGAISSEYGASRVYDDGRIGWQHRGVDLVAEEGAPVQATNAGIVRLAKALKVHGNTVVLDHGQGIFSIYNHLSKINVTQGERIEKKFILGQVGMTGLATGPHLHFGLSVNNVRVDPLQWTETGPL